MSQKRFLGTGTPFLLGTCWGLPALLCLVSLRETDAPGVGGCPLPGTAV